VNDAVRYETSGGVATLTMDQPESRNALTPSLLNGLGDGLQAAQNDPAVRVVVLTNNGPAFCAGADLSGRSRQEQPRYGVAEVLGGILDCPKPVVGRIAGHCLGGGVGLAAACDIAIADNTVQFGFTEVRLGVAPAIISVVCLPKLNRRDALALFLTGERIGAAHAARVGLIYDAVPPTGLDSAIAELLAKLRAGGPAALAAAKRMIFQVPAMDRATAFNEMTKLSQALFASEEAAEGMAAFREKRHPSWVP
jgi:methylglutaconyl-CoA hydratase